MGLGSWLLRVLYGAGGLVGMAVALLYIFQEKMLYVPQLPGVASDYVISPERYGVVAEDVDVMTADGIKLHGWMLSLGHWSAAHKRSRPVVLFFQENAGNMSFRLPFLRLMLHRLDCPVFAVSYRGYFHSKGKPNEAGLKLDAAAALEHLRSRNDVNTNSVVVYGRSLGGAVALHLTASQPDKIAGLIVENTFLSVEDMVSRVVPPLGYVIGPGKPLNFLVTNKWHNRNEVAKIRDTPLLMLVSELDEMVPASQMYDLYELAKARQKQLVTIAGAHHMDAYDVAPEQYWTVLRGFMQQYIEPKL